MIGPVGQAEPVELQSTADVAALLQQTINDILQLENTLYRRRTLGCLAGYCIRALDMAVLERRVAALEHALKRSARRRGDRTNLDQMCIFGQRGLHGL